GFGTTTLSGLNIVGSATTTSNVGYNLTSGCFSVNGTCITSGGVGSGTQGQLPFYNAAGTNLTATSTLTLTQAGYFGIGTTSPLAKLSVYGDLFLEGSNRYLNFGTTQGTSGYGIRDNLGVMEFKNTNGMWVPIGGSLTSWGLSEASATNTGSTLPGILGRSQTAVIGDYVYLFGGNNTAYTNVIYRAPVSNPTSWSDTGSTIPGNLGNSQTAVIGDYVYLFGGYNGTAYTNVIYRAPVSNPTSWTNTGSTLSGNLGNSQTAVIGDYVYLFGGYNTAYTNVIYRIPVWNGTPGLGSNKEWVYRANGGSGTSTAAFTQNGNWFGALATVGTNDNWGLAIETNGTERARFDTSGNFGIGTSSPYSKLTVWGADTLSTSRAFEVANSASTTLFTIMNGGNVGIGTTSPYAKLSVTGQVVANNFTATSTNATSTFAGGAVFGYNGSALTNFGETLDVLGSFAVENPAGTDNFFVGTNGNVGVSSSTPWARLSVHALSTDTDQISPLFAISSTTPSGTASTTFVMTRNGRMGIGTSAPTTTLDVIGGITISSGALSSDYISSRYPTLGFNSFSSGYKAGTTGYGALIQLDNTTGDGTYYNGTNVAAGATHGWIAATTWRQNGNFGVGTTSPYAQLSVQASSASTIGLVVKNANSQTADLFRLENAAGSPLMVLKGVDGTFYLSSLITSSATGNYLCINTSTYEVTRGNGSACTTSSIRFKENVKGLSYGLADVAKLNPVIFNYKQEMNMGTTTHLGFIAEEMFPIIPEVVNIDKDGLPSGIDYPVLTAVLTKALQETVSILDIRNAATSSQTLLSYYSATGTPAIYVDAAGNIGIGTTTPNYKLTVDGEVAAKGFVNISTRAAKKDIVYITAMQEEEALQKIKETNIATYNYNGESCAEPVNGQRPNVKCSLRLGLIAEEAPSEVLSIDGKGVDLYKMTSFAWLGLKAQEKRINDLELRIKDLETRFPNNWRYTAGATSTNTLPDVWSTNGSLLAAVVSALQDLGITFTNGAIQAREFIADQISAKKLCLDDVCVTRDELKQLLDKNQIAPASAAINSQLTTNNFPASATSTATVEIIMNGNNQATLNVGDAYGDLGAYASTTDASIVALGVRAFQNGVEVATPLVDTSVAGTYEIVYKIVDGSGNIIAEATRTVIVQASVVSQTAAITTPETTASSTAPVL
ncbi:MAG: tail fiber domain-containing protein, partial [Candidatus Niyogibacteria bacterium]|nr:tail fiber domain-containing protein [Candidatus Niyogibacteria bacterium]